MAHAKGFDFSGAQQGFIGFGAEAGVALAVVGEQHRATTFGEQAQGMGMPGVHVQLTGNAAHGQATHTGAVPDGLQQGAGREGAAQANFVGQARDLGHAQIANAIVHAFHPLEQTEQGRVDGAHHGGR